MWAWLKRIFQRDKPKLPSITQTLAQDDDTKFFIRRVLNAFEMGRTTVDYGALYIYKDGPNNTPQLTVSFGLTSSGRLKTFIERYIAANAKFSKEFKPYVKSIPTQSIVHNIGFQSLLKKAAKEDKVYRDLMDDMYYEFYFNPAVEWCKQNGFKHPLSLLVIADSFLHSGSILSSLRSRFPEPTPQKGGDEKTWITQYCLARESWLRNHSRKILNKTSVRPRTYLGEIAKNNWDLKSRPINCNGIIVS